MISRPATTSKPRRLVLAALVLASLATALACSNLRYYGQAIWGQTRILVKRQSIAGLVRSPETPEDLRDKLKSILRMREFAIRELALPDNGSYRGYVELGLEDDGSRRRFVVWNVVAAPELSTEPVTWCFPVAGCVSYRGYFSRARARKFADRLGEKGFDVAVSGAAAYSTLGWFKDPVLSTVIDYPDVYLAGLIFHELAHQQVYVKGDTRFNESFATSVEIEGVKRWLEAEREDPAALEDYLVRMRREEEFAELVLGYRDRLLEVYCEEETADWKRRRKDEVFADLKRAYGELRASWDGYSGYDGWFENDLNNAHLVSVGAYHGLVPGFQELLGDNRGDLESFYDAVRKIAELDAEERDRRLEVPGG